MEITVNQFQTQCLQIFNALQSNQEEVIITANGMPIAKIIPFAPKKPVLFGRMSGTAKIIGDIEQPLAEVWDAEQ
jgi:antitoxin (DNA-binding transcriptional repressor) of toxin-antitoxin stability system